MNPSEIFCQIRKKWVAALPEEIIRQRLLRHMIEELGYPPQVIAVEKSLSQIPHLAGMKLPLRRADILCFGPTIHPLLVIECKAVPLAPKALRQLVGYNFYLKSSYIALANETELKCGWYNVAKKDYHFIDHLLPYHRMIHPRTE